MFISIAVIVLLGFGLSAPTAVAEQDPCAAAPPPQAPPPAAAPPAVNHDHPRFQDPWGWIEDAFWGVGFLEPTDDPYEWPAKTVIPLYRNPGGRHAGWINRGWLERGQRVPISPYAFVETGYETNSLILADVRDDGWLGLRLTDAAPADGGILWTHACRLDLGEVGFEIVLWRDFFRSERPVYVRFRSPIPHALRSRPSTDSERLMWIGENDDLEALEVRDDWMRVRVFQPGRYSTFCRTGDREWQGRTETGWVRWWSSDKGTWLGFPTRGC